ncbi:MAG: outer membrane protein assembly factor BamA [Kiritimatiellia bacterium]|nr:outer membrane protein assembly factor BamA [Kiritimatiellia bacterium]MDD4174185.1 outer membrane protein assembly factor BamA [Kiritimatiellia bacterium]MDD4440462.1 outer membrane protein assembly factor BamA [Kiritimatiellia bacterium]MDX9794331.1 outer membrane protein assembly factor BamA [Kiritimatiellia bacterium]
MRMSIRAWAAAVVFSAACVMGAETLVKDVSVRVLDQFGTDATDVLSFCSVQPGAELSQEALSKDVRALLDTGRYGYAGVELEKVEGGVRVVYVVKRRYRFQEPLAIKGAEYLSERKIRKLSELKSGDYIDEPVLSSKVSKIRDEYVKKFFPNIKIGAEIQPIPNSAGAANVIFTVEEGERAKVRKYRFTGNVSIPDKELRSSFGQRPWYDPRGWFTDTPVSAQDLEDARQMAEDVYKNAGYLDARVAAPVMEKVGKEKVDVVFGVTEGDQYTVDSTAIRGVKLFPEREVLASGERLKVDAVAGQQTIDDAAKDIRDYYGSRGYVDTAVRAVKDTVPGKPGRMAITYDVREGELVYIRNIVIRGNNKTKDKVIRREVMVSPGEIMNEPRIERSENRLKNLQYFKTVRHYSEQTDKAGVRDLVYEVEEQRTGNFMVGAGVSSIDNVVGFMEITQSNFDILNWPNFTGGGQKARLGVELGSRRQTAEVSWTEPWFMDRPLALTVEAYRRMRWYDQYDEIRTGGSVGLSYPVKVGRVGMRYTLELVEMDDVEDGDWDTDMNDDPVETGDFDSYFKYQEKLYGDAINSVLRLYWAHDTRDHAFIPTKGYQTTVFGEASESGIGETEYYKLGANYRHWFRMPWYKHVLSLRGRVETVDSYGDDEVPIYERLFLGGPRTVRGVEYRDIGPKVFRGSVDGAHAPIGGETLALVTAEYTIPVFKAVRFATFMDVGSIGEDAFDPELSDVCVTAGVGLRIDIPGFPIRFDFAVPVVEDDDYTDDEVFSFAIGFE